MNASQTSPGENWTLGVRGGDYQEWGDEVNSSDVTILLINTSIDTWDDTDTQIKRVNEQVYFYGNYTDINGNPINGTSIYCDISLFCYKKYLCEIR